MRWFGNAMVVGPFLQSSKKLKFSSWKMEFAQLGIVLIAISVLVAFNQNQYNRINAHYMRNFHNPACWCIGLQACKYYCLMSFLWPWSCNNWVNQPNKLLSATVSLHFYLLLNISLYKILAHSIFVRTAMLDSNQWHSQCSWIVGTVKRYTERW